MKIQPTPTRRPFGLRLRSRARAWLTVSALAALAVSTHSLAQAPTFNTLVTTYTGDPNYEHPQNAVVGDFNGDGKLDAVINANSSNLRLMLGNGNGTFTQKYVSVPGASGGPMQAGDLNGDGKLDVILGSSQGNLAPAVLLNTGNDPNGVPQFTVTSYAAMYSGIRSLTVGDLNGDSKPDFIIGNANGEFKTYLNNGNGTFTGGLQRNLQPGAGGPSVGPGVIADMNGDGKADYLVTSNQNHAINIFLGNADGTFQATPTIISSTDGQWPVVSDVNNDGRRDFLAVDIGTGKLQVYLQNVNGTFSGPTLYSTGLANPCSLVFTDMNGDGKSDVVTSDYNIGSGINNVAVLLGNGDGTFGAANLYNSTQRALDLSVGDFNGDGKPDIATVGYNDDTYGVRLNTTVFPVEFATPSRVNWTGRYSFGHIKSSTGPLDVMTSDDGGPWSGQATHTIYANNGTGTFTQTGQISAGGYLGGAVNQSVLADLNGDGFDDIVAVGNGGFVVYLNNGAGIFPGNPNFHAPSGGSATAYFSAGFGPGTIAAARTSPGGHVDLAISGFGNGKNKVAVFRGNGDGTFATNPVILISGNHPYAGFHLKFLDLDGNGYPAIVVGGGDQNGVSVFRNNGSGSYANRDYWLYYAYYNNDTAAIDMDNDGRLDLVVAAFDGTTGRIVWYRNLGNSMFEQTPGGQPYEAKARLAFSGKIDGFDPQYLVWYDNGTAMFAISSADLDGDGQVDLMGSSQVANPTILRNNGNGTFSLAWKSARVVTDNIAPPANFAAAHFMYFVDVTGTGQKTLFGANYRNNSWQRQNSWGLRYGPNLSTPAVSAPVVASASASGINGTAFTYQISATNSPVSYTATGLPPGLSVSTSTGAITGTPTQSGSFSVAISATNTGGTGTGTLTLTIAKAAAAIALSNLSQTYDGTEKSATATTTPASLTVTFNYVGGRINAGSYDFIASVTDTNYTGSTTGTLVINPAPVTVSLSNLSPTYIGTPLAAGVTTSPTGVATSVTYNGSATVPTAAGTYAVVVTVTDSNYTGSTTGSLVINPAAAAVSLSNLSPTYTGAPLAAGVTTSPAGVTTSITYNGAATVPTAAGTYAVVATVTDPNYTGSTTGSLVIGKATATVVVTPYTVTFDGSPRSATITSITGVNGETGATVGTVDVSNTTHTNAGTYATDSWSFTGAANYNDVAATPIANAIGKANATVVVTPYNVTYNGQPRSATVTSLTGANGETGATVGVVTLNTTHTNAGTYATDSWSFTGAANYNNIAATTITNTIGRANATVVVTPYNVTYNGQPRSATVTSITGVNLESGATVGTVSLSTTHTNAGTYATDSWSFAGTANYNTIAATTITNTIAKAPATVTLGSLNQTYSNGQPRPAMATTSTAPLPSPGPLLVVFTYNGSSTAPTEAGTYTVVGTINHANFAGTATGTLRVNKAAATIRVAASTRTYSGSPQAGVATTTPANLPVTFTYNGSATAPTKVGVYTVVGRINHPNYTGAAAGRLTINRATATVTLGSLAQTYNGTPRRATTVPAGVPVIIRYNNSTTVPTDAGNYAVTATVTSPNYNATITRGTLVVAKATATVTVSNIAQTFDGTRKSAVVATSPAGLAVRITYNGSTTAPSAANTYPVVATVNHPNYTGTGTGQLLITANGPTVSSLSPTFAVGGTSGFTLTVRGTRFNASSVVRFGANSLATTFVDSTTLTATVPAALLPIPAGGISTLQVMALDVTGNIISTAKPFQILSPAVGPSQTVSAAPGQTVTSQVLPQAGRPGVSATFNHSSLAGQGATLTTAVYTSNPAPAKRINLGGGIVDLQIVGADPADSATVQFYYSSTVRGLTETFLVPRFWNGTRWVNILSSGGRAPVKNTTDNLDRTLSGGRFTIVFDNTSTPRITELAGTIIGMAINTEPVASAGPDQTVDADEGGEATVTLNGSASTDADEDEELTYEWRKGREVLGDTAVLTTTLEVGVHTLTLEVTDEAGETSTDTVVITVRDTTAPTLILPADIIRSTKNSEGRKVRYDVDVLDFGTAYRDIKLTYSHRSGSRFPLGDTTVTVTAKDKAGNVATGTFTITVTLRVAVDDDDGNGSCDDDDDDDRDHNHRGDRDRDRDDDGRRN